MALFYFSFLITKYFRWWHWEEHQPHHGHLPGVYLLSPQHGWVLLLGVRSCPVSTVLQALLFSSCGELCSAGG